MEEELIKEDEEKKEENEELPEEGEIMDDEEEKTQTTIEQQKEQNLEQQQIQQLSPNNLSEYQQSFTNNGGRQQTAMREFQKGGTWRKSFSSHHGGGGRGNSIGGSRYSRGGIDTVQYRDFDGHIAMKNDDQQEEMFDSWNACIRGGTHQHNFRRGGRINSPSGGGDISPIRTSPMINEDNNEVEESNYISSSELTTKKQIIVGEQHQLDDDKDFRAIEAENTKSSSTSPSLQRKSSPRHQYSDDNDFRRSSAQHPQHSNFNRETSPPPCFSEARQFEKNRRRHRSQSPLLNVSTRLKFPPESEDLDTSYETSAKRYRQFYDNPSTEVSGFTPKDENLENSPSFDENGPWSSHLYRSGGDDTDFSHSFNYDKSIRGGRTQGWGYRGGRPFFPRLICKFFREGFCRDGDHCTFSHLTGDSHRRPELCRYYQQGYCKKGLFCQLMHGEWPCKAFHKGECSKEQCSFSHEPLDDVSRPIMDKILEEERLGLTCPQAQQHTRFDAPQQQSFNSSGGVRPFFRPTRFQVPFQNQSMQSGGSSFNQLQTPQTPHLTTPQQSYRNPHQQKGIGAPPIQQQQFFKHQQPTDVTGVQIPPPPAEINNEETGGICQKQTPIPPPGLVMPPPLGGGSPLPLPPNSSATTFGFFNPVSSTTSGNQPSQIIQSQPPSFQQLQQQVQQVSGPHFPHQPSLLGPSVAAAQAQAMLTAILQSQQQQIGSTQTKKDSHDNLLQQSPPSSQLNKDEVLQLQNIESQPTKTEAQETEANTGGFNINQMLEQITQQNSPPHPPADLIIVKREEANTLDLLANVGLSETKNIIEDSPASPVFATEQIQETEDKPAALIPVVSAWKLHLIDLTPLTETSDMHFDIKLVQQISSSNSDPRLRKIAEKQFDLVSRTLEQQQQQANQHKLNSNEGLIISSNFPFSTENKNQSEQIQKEIEDQEFCEHYEVGVIDPRTKDPRRRSTSGQIIDNKSLSMVNNSTIPDEAELVKKQMAALEAAAKHQQNCEQQSQMFGTQIGIRQQIGLTSPINFQIPPPAFLTGNPISNPCFNVPPPPPFSLPQQVSQNFSLPSTYQQQQTNKIEITNQPKFETQIFSNEQIASSSSSSLDLSNKPTNSSFEKSRSDDSHFPSFHYSGGGYRGRRGRYSHNYQHHKQQYYRENHQRIQRSESPPQLQQQEQTSTSSTNISLREKRKNNEYESPLARMAGNRY